MNVFKLTRRLIDIESITPNEMELGNFLFGELSSLVKRHGGHIEKMPVEGERFNVLAHWGDPVVTLSTHQDTVPPFIPSREDDDWIWGRGACDVKGLMACMIEAAAQLLDEGVRNFALLFVVGEERNSAGAFEAARRPRGSKFLINGEPTGNKLALGSKGALRYEIEAHGKMAHSAYPELGESAIEKLLDILNDLRSIKLPRQQVLGQSTLNIGLISGGRAPNVVPDLAQAEIMIRLVDDAQPVKDAVRNSVAGRADLNEIICIPALHLGSLEGLDTCVVAFTTDIPAFGGAWGQPFLLGPGSIHYAHTSEERVLKQELVEAIQLYKQMVKQLLAR